MKFTIENLSSIFPLEIPKTLQTENDYGDVNETHAFVGVAWKDVTSEILQKDFEVACFFSPEAMRYFLPAYILLSQAKPEAIKLPLDYLFFMMQFTENEDWMKSRNDIWCNLTAAQMQLVKDWLAWFQKTPYAEEHSNLPKAVERMNKIIRT